MANFFPRWTNWLPLKIVVCGGVLSVAVSAAVTYYFTPKYTNIGYQPNQPVPFSHAIHAGQLGMDCRYCHSFVEVAAHSNVPNSQVCMNCHSQVQKDNPKLAALRASWDSNNLPVNWVQIHKTPDYVYFNHSVHVNRGVSCVSCHGRIDKVEVVAQEKPLSMGWCLDCHRAPETALRPQKDVFNLGWQPPAGMTQHEIGLKIKNEAKINPPDTNCWGCHR